MPPSTFPGDSSSDDSQSTLSSQLTTASNSQIPSYVIFNMTQSTSTHAVGAIDGGQALANAFNHALLSPTIQPQHHFYTSGINNGLNQHPSAYPIPLLPGYMRTNARHGTHVSSDRTPSHPTAFGFPPSTPWQTSNSPFTPYNLNDIPLPPVTPGREQYWNIFRQQGMFTDGPTNARQDHATSSTDQFRRIQREYHMCEAARNSRIQARILQNHRNLWNGLDSGQPPQPFHLIPNQVQMQTFEQSFSEESSSSSSSSSQHMQQDALQTRTSLHSTYFETLSSSSASHNTSTTSSMPSRQSPVPPRRASTTTQSSKKVSSSRSCRFCDKNFSRSNNRAKHELYIHYHGVPAEYRCIWKHCHKPFKRKGDLGRHIREHHLDLHYRYECRCPSRQGESSHCSDGSSSSSSSSSSRSPSIDTGHGRSHSRVRSGEPLFYKREAGGAARLCGCDPQGAPVYPWHLNADPLRRRTWDWDEIYENWNMIQWAGLSPELCWELELLVIQELARTVPVAVEGEDEGPV